MASPGRLAFSPPRGGSLEDELAYYKAQYEQLEVELQEFQQSSKELEAELERDIEESEKKERQLQESVEGLRYEVDEWKTKYKQSKTEASNAQANLQREVTQLRDANRTLQLKIRDIEVQNDDFERQARHQTSSLEDLESKYNQSIERGVILEEEIRIMEREREDLRIQNQRLRDELSDLKVELEIVQGKLQHSESALDRYNEKPRLDTDGLRPRSPLSETSTSITASSSPTTSTPPLSKLNASVAQATPPSPPLSDASAKAPNHTNPVTPMPSKKRVAQPPNTTPRPSGIRPPRHSRGPSIPTRTPATASRVPSGTATRRVSATQPPVPRSGSLHQIRGLIGKMQRLEERVHTARSKLPAPTATPPRASPRGSSMSHHAVPPTVTVRSARKRASASTTSSATGPYGDVASNVPTTPTASRLSFGFNPNPPATTGSTRVSAVPGGSRPSSRASYTSVSGQFARPGSRASISGASGRITPLSFADSTGAGSRQHRPRSSISGSYSAMHGGGAGIAGPRSQTPNPGGRQGHAEDADGFAIPQGSVNRRATLDKSGIPSLSGIPAPRRRESGGLVGRRQSGADELMRPPSSRGVRKTAVGAASGANMGLGETF